MFQAVWERELHGSPEARVRRATSSSLDLVQRLQLQRKLSGHHGCVNTVSFDQSGSILLSGSDDHSIILWDWEAGHPLLRFSSGHRGNVFQARDLPGSGLTCIASAAADGQVRLSTVAEGAGSVDVVRTLLWQHDGRAHKLALDPVCPRWCFYSCGEDGEVAHFDVRQPHSRCGQRLLKVKAASRNNSSSLRVLELNAISVNPTRPSQLAVCGSDEWVRVYDVRRAPHNGVDSGGAGVRSAGLVDRLCPAHLRPGWLGGPQRRWPHHITCVVHSRGGRLLASYSDEDMYLFEALGQQQEQGQGQGVATQQPESEGGEGGGPGPTVPDGVLHRFSGHRNCNTVKGCAFLGASDEYVMSGSDCGHIYIWSTLTAVLHSWLPGDSHTVNCLEPHPWLPMTLATSGIDDDIKLWAPTAPERQSVPPEAARVMQRSQRERAAQAAGGGARSLVITPDMLRELVSAMHARHGGRGESGDSDGSDGSGDEGEEDGSEPGCHVS